MKYLENQKGRAGLWPVNQTWIFSKAKRIFKVALVDAIRVKL